VRPTRQSRPSTRRAALIHRAKRSFTGDGSTPPTAPPRRAARRPARQRPTADVQHQVPGRPSPGRRRRKPGCRAPRSWTGRSGPRRSPMSDERGDILSFHGFPPNSGTGWFCRHQFRTGTLPSGRRTLPHARRRLSHRGPLSWRAGRHRQSSYNSAGDRTLRPAHSARARQALCHPITYRFSVAAERLRRFGSVPISPSYRTSRTV
jgi:hypothetical protein